jgi:hypothetical protein
LANEVLEDLLALRQELRIQAEIEILGPYDEAYL